MNNTVKICNINNEINEKIYKRNLPDHELQPLYNPLPLSTKYNSFPITSINITGDNYNSNKTKCKTYENFNTETNFNPGSRAPINHYLQSIDLESTLRNQHLRVSKYGENCWIPSTLNNLYKDYNPFNKSIPLGCIDEHISNEQVFNNFNPNKFEGNVGNSVFNNNTRVQLKTINNVNL